jgi:hypothetical protein
VDCERAGAEQAWVVVGSFSKWHGVAGREDRVADDRRVGGGRKRRGADEQDDGRWGDDDDGHADKDAEPGRSLYIYDVYI